MPERPKPVDLTPLDHQDGIASRRQLQALGVTPAQIRQHLAAGRWQRLYPGVYAMFSGPVPKKGRIWAALLAAGDGAVIGGHTALWLAGLDGPGLRPDRVEIVIPAGRKVRPSPGLDIRRCRRLPFEQVLRSAPPRLRVESALLDTTDQAPAATAIGLVIAAVQQRLTTAGRLAAELEGRPRHRQRACSWRS